MPSVNDKGLVGYKPNPTGFWDMASNLFALAGPSLPFLGAFIDDIFNRKSPSEIGGRAISGLGNPYMDLINKNGLLDLPGWYKPDYRLATQGIMTKANADIRNAYLGAGKAINPGRALASGLMGAANAAGQFEKLSSDSYNNYLNSLAHLKGTAMTSLGNVVSSGMDSMIKYNTTNPITNLLTFLPGIGGGIASWLGDLFS